MVAAGVPMRTLQEWMGHRGIAMTQRYADYAPNEREVRWWIVRLKDQTNV
jgi:integrase